MHGCLGAPLARLEAKVALEEGLPALGDYTIAAPPVRYRTTPNMYVWDNLHLSFPVVAEPEHRPHVETVQRDSTSMTVLTREFEADVRVESKDEAADGVVTLTLRQIADSPLPPWAPGAHVDLILDGTDNVETRFLINDLAVKHGIPWVYGACIGTEGRVMTILPECGPCRQSVASGQA